MENSDLTSEQTKSLSTEFLERLLNIDSMRLLARRETSITTKRSPWTLQINKASIETEGVTRHSLHLDYLVSSFLINLRESDPAAFETVSNIAFASMAAEAIACFREPQKEAGDLSSLTVLLDTPLVLDMLGVNAEYADYGKDLLQMLKESGCNVAVLDHSVAEAENTIQAKLAYMRSGINQLALGTSVRPNFLAALSGNVAERVEARLQIKIKRDPEINLHRRSQTTVGDIESDMNSRMAAWRNEDAKDHDRKSVWAMISLRDSTLLQPRICKAGWLLLTRNTPLLKISNDAWKTWLKGSTKHSQANIERCPHLQAVLRCLMRQVLEFRFRNCAALRLRIYSHQIILQKTLYMLRRKRGQVPETYLSSACSGARLRRNMRSMCAVGDHCHSGLCSILIPPDFERTNVAIRID